MMLYRVMQVPAYKSLDNKAFLELVLHPNKSTYQNLAKLAAIGVMLPVTSVNCERGISAYNAIKTDARIMIYVPHMDHLVTMYLQSPGLDKFDFERCFDLWVQIKDRRSYAYRVNKCQIDLKLAILHVSTRSQVTLR